MAWPARDRRRHPISGETYATRQARARAMRADGCTMATIMEALGVSKPTAWKWVRDLPCHGEITRANARAGADQRRIYPPGSLAYVRQLTRKGVTPIERIRLAREAAQ